MFVGATKPEQLEENLGAIDVAKRLTADDMSRINEILGLSTKFPSRIVYRRAYIIIYLFAGNSPDNYAGYGGSGARRLELMDE